MQFSESNRLRIPGAPHLVPGTVLALWIVLATIFASSPPGSDWRYFTGIALTWTAPVFAGLYVVPAAVRLEGTMRAFWALFGVGLLFRFFGDAIWTASQLAGYELAARPLAPQDLAYAISYALLAGAMLWLVRLATTRLTLVSALDALAIMLSVGTLAWYFVLGPAVEEAGIEGFRNTLVVLSQPVCDAALLYLSLVVLSTARRPPFTGLLAATFAVFLAADIAYLFVRSQGPFQPGNWPDLLWSLGLLFAGFAAIRTTSANVEPQGRIEPWRIFAFWLGPLSPAVHFAFMFVWAAFRPPLPGFVLAGAAVLLFYMALRVALVSFVSRRLSTEQEETARKLEQSRILYEMHDTVKQSVHGISLLLRSALEAGRRGDPDTVRERLGHAYQSVRETEYRISRPYDELETIHNEDLPRPDDFLRQRLARFEEYFGIKGHEDLRTPLNVLSPAEFAAAYRVVVEAFWNVAKHSGARNMYLESRQVGSVVIVRVRDDGRGFEPEDSRPGMGLRYLRRRAREVGAELDIISAPGRGTTVQLRFDKK